MFTRVEENVYFGSKPLKLGSVNSPETYLAVDRLGSIRRSGKDYFPYGQEAPTTTAGDKEKYATYKHDAATDLSYADQRYYATGVGRFMTADPYTASGGASEPGSWNRYSYSGRDPVNLRDPSGLIECLICPVPAPAPPTPPGIGPNKQPGGPEVPGLEQLPDVSPAPGPGAGDQCHRTWETAPLEDSEWGEFANDAMSPEESAEIGTQQGTGPQLQSASAQPQAVPVLAALTAAQWVLYWARKRQPDNTTLVSPAILSLGRHSMPLVGDLPRSRNWLPMDEWTTFLPRHLSKPISTWAGAQVRW